ncbi:MAG TPA: hypothetical protein VFD23_07065, partial [Clostridia bacterium]|nr:hypothetical protein [Clostridia bacterium]
MWDNGCVFREQNPAVSVAGPDNLNDVFGCGRTEDSGQTEDGGRTQNGGRTQFAPTVLGKPPKLSFIGERIDNEIKKISGIYSNVKINKHVIMPNHIHMIIMINGFCDGGSESVYAENGQNLCDDEGTQEASTEKSQKPCDNGGTQGALMENGQKPRCRGELCSPASEGEESRLTLSRIIKQFKGSISKQIGYSIWQKSFHDH